MVDENAVAAETPDVIMPGTPTDTIDLVINEPIAPNFSDEDAAIQNELAVKQAQQDTRSVFLKKAVEAVKVDALQEKIALAFNKNCEADYTQLQMELLPMADIPVEKQTQHRLATAMGNQVTINTDDVLVIAVRVPKGRSAASFVNALGSAVGLENVVAKSYATSANPDTRKKIRNIVLQICETNTEPECSNAANNPPYGEFMQAARDIAARESARII